MFPSFISHTIDSERFGGFWGRSVAAPGGPQDHPDSELLTVSTASNSYTLKTEEYIDDQFSWSITEKQGFEEKHPCEPKANTANVHNSDDKQFVEIALTAYYERKRQFRKPLQNSQSLMGATYGFS